MTHDRANESEYAHPRENGGIGGRIRELRTLKKMSVQKLAQMSDLTPSTISQLERNLTNPSIPAIRRIAAALGVPVFYFFMEEKIDESLIIVRSHSRKKLFNPTRNISFELLSPNLNQNLEVIEMNLERGVSSSDELFTHTGEEACLVLEGELTIQLGEQEYVLNEADCIQFNSGIPHRYVNSKSLVTRLIVVLTPPSF